jgi:hypothetical protein
MVPSSLAAILLLSFVFGMRHALDADHIAAVAALSDGTGGMRRAILRGAAWGTGHALVLGAVGGVVVLLRVAIPEPVVRLFESLVAAMLVGLGAAAIVAAARARLHVHAHEHDGVGHVHLHFHAARVEHAPADHGAAPHRHPHPLRFALRPLLVGGMHGLAGSAALSLLVLATVPTALLGCAYLVVFGAGSIAGMAIMSLLLTAPLLLAERRALRLHRALRFAAGLGSVLIGLRLGWQMWRGV